MIYGSDLWDFFKLIKEKKMKRTFKEMVTYITKQTDVYRKTSKKGPKDRKDDQIINAYINNDFGCTRKSVGLLVNALMGKKIISNELLNMSDDGNIAISLLNGVCIVPLIDNCDYVTGEPCVNVEGGYCLRQYGGIGDIEISLDKGAYRYATNSEIKSFVEQIGLSILNEEL